MMYNIVWWSALAMELDTGNIYYIFDLHVPVIAVNFNVHVYFGPATALIMLCKYESA